MSDRLKKKKTKQIPKHTKPKTKTTPVVKKQAQQDKLENT